MKFGERFELQQLLGHGQAETWRALDTTDGMPVVVKMLRLGDRTAWKGVELFEREVLTQSQLKHPSLARMVAYDLGESDPDVWAFAQSWVEGVDLRNAEVNSEEELITIARAVLEVLAYFQSFSPPVIHRDIKPANIVRTETGVAVVDLGAVQLVTPSDEGGSTVVGTSGYMAPEQLMGRATASSDLYGLGMTLVWLVTRREPETLPVSKMKVMWQNATVLPVGRDTASFIDALIQPLASQRPETAQVALKLLDGSKRQTALVMVSAPYDTRIEARRGKDSLEIVYTPEFNLAMFVAIGVAGVIVMAAIAKFATLENSFTAAWMFLAGAVSYGAFWYDAKSTRRLIFERNRWRYLIRNRVMARGQVEDVVGLAPMIINNTVRYANLVTREKPAQLFLMTPAEIEWLNSEIEGYKANMDRS